jgi:hypothetical protein
MKRFLDNSLELGRNNFPKLGKKKTMERLEIKKGGHHIPNP